MSFVCYPLISEKQYYDKGLNVVSEKNETIFEEDLSDSVKLYQKFAGRYNIDKRAKHDELDAKNFALIRHHFEPTFDLKLEQETLNPGYSRLRTYRSAFDDNDAIEIAEEYFKGIKEVVFVSSITSLTKLVSEGMQSFSANGRRILIRDFITLLVESWSREKLPKQLLIVNFRKRLESADGISDFID